MNKTATIDHQGEVIPMQPTQLPAVRTPMEMIELALSKGATPEVLAQMMALQERWEANQARKAFDAALAAARSEIPVIIKNRTVDFTSQKGRTNYRHEDLAEIARTVDPILGKHGLSYRFRTASVLNEPVSVTCILSHGLGHSEENTLTAGRDETGNKNGIQAIGSTITYLQRYTLKAALGLAASADDDGRGGPKNKDEITPEQEDKLRDKLRSLLTETKSNVEKFVALYDAPSVSDIPVGKLKDAIAKVELKKQRAAS